VDVKISFQEIGLQLEGSVWFYPTLDPFLNPLSFPPHVPFPSSQMEEI
jgi:hypothetical protein